MGKRPKNHVDLRLEFCGILVLDVDVEFSGYAMCPA